MFVHNGNIKYNYLITWKKCRACGFASIMHTSQILIQYNRHHRLLPQRKEQLLPRLLPPCTFLFPGSFHILSFDNGVLSSSMFYDILQGFMQTSSQMKQFILINKWSYISSKSLFTRNVIPQKKSVTFLYGVICRWFCGSALLLEKSSNTYVYLYCLMSNYPMAKSFQHFAIEINNKNKNQ